MTKRKDGRWQQTVVMTVNGERVRRSFYGKTKADVYRAIADFEEKTANAAFFDNIAALWWDEHELTLSESTKPSYKRAYLRAVDYFKHTPVAEITVQDVSRYLQKVIAKYKMAKKTAASHLSVLSLIFTYACVNGYAAANPCQFVKLPMLKSTPRHVPCSSDIEIIKKDHASLGGRLAYWALYTGLRKGELLALTWSDIDIETRTLTVSKSACTAHNLPQLKTTKTATSNRVVPILDKLMPEIKKGKGYVFTRGDGEQLSAKAFEYAWNRYRAQSGITCTLHQLRHAFATMLLEANVPIKDAQAMLGHAQASTTQDVYADIRRERQALYPELYRSLDIK